MDFSTLHHGTPSGQPLSAIPDPVDGELRAVTPNTCAMSEGWRQVPAETEFEWQDGCCDRSSGITASILPSCGLRMCASSLPLSWMHTVATRTPRDWQGLALEETLTHRRPGIARGGTATTLPPPGSWVSCSECS